MNWLPAYSVGITEIDEQHKRLVAMINELHEGMSAQKGRETLVSVVNGLTEYADEHFAFEEKYMQKFNYNDFIAHKRQHDAFREKVGKFRDGVVGKKLFVSLDMMDYLKDWLVTHIQGSDMLYMDCFFDNGLR